MIITENDIRMFYELYSRFNLTSPNIAVVGDSKKFDRICKEVLKTYKTSNARVIKGINKLRIITNEDIEVAYIRIQNLNDMRGYYFRKFI